MTRAKKKPFTIQQEPEILNDFSAFCGHVMEPTQYLATLQRELALVRPEFALKVLGLIPEEWKKRRPGRPPSSTTRADTVAAGHRAELAEQDVA